MNKQDKNKMKYPIAYAGYNKNLEIRLQSTSGGIFTLLGELIIKEYNGVVIGAGYNKSFEVEHMCVETVEDLKYLRGSKYAQSKINCMYSKVKEYLEQDRVVLFTGTPCQIHGLYSFLGGKSENLFCMDLVCHGVASPGLWKGYLENFTDYKNIKQIVLKHKIKGWKQWHVNISYANKDTYIRGWLNPFIRSFGANSNIRPSCYECRFKGLSRISDFTISDCWGIGETNEELNDNRGLSAFLIQNERGEEIFNKIKSNITYQEYDAAELMEGNFTTVRSIEPDKNRNTFFTAIHEMGMHKGYIKCFNPKLIDWVRYFYLRLKGKER